MNVEAARRKEQKYSGVPGSNGSSTSAVRGRVYGQAQQDNTTAHAAIGPGALANEAAAEKQRKYAATASSMHAEHWPFAVETMGGLSISALQLVREIHHSALSHRTWRDADAIGSHLLNSIAIAVQRCTGMALRESLEREVERVYGPQVA